MNHSDFSAPLVVGGVGGSGTRLITQCLQEMGYFMGHDLNHANDNLWFTLLFKRIEILSASEEEVDELVEILLKGLTGFDELTQSQKKLVTDLSLTDRPQHAATWLKQRAETLLAARSEIKSATRWGWKEPNSHIILDRLIKRLSNIKYIHVIRNGLDMAYSTNQNQLNLWGSHFIQESFKPTPYYSLRYWCITHQRIIDLGKSMGNNFLLLNYDNFCLNPTEGISQLSNFLGLAIHEMNPQIRDLIQIPQSIGRFKQTDLQIFSEEDIEYVHSLGFDVSTE